MVHEVPLEATRSLEELEVEVDVMLRPRSGIQGGVACVVRQASGPKSLFDALHLTAEQNAVIDDEHVPRFVEELAHITRVARTGLEDATLDQAGDIRHRQ